MVIQMINDNFDLNNISNYPHITHSEYMGEGYPDLNRKKIRFRVYYEELVMIVETKKENLIDFNSDYKLYNLLDDKLELKEYKNKKDVRINIMIDYINTRIIEIDSFEE